MTAGRRHQRLIAAAAAGLMLAAVLIVQATRDSAGAAGGPVAVKSKIFTKTVKMGTLDDRVRQEVFCPRGKFPYGGGFSTSPAPTDGEGIYPNSYERLGVQHGYHITMNLVDLLGNDATARDVQLQVVCGPKPGAITPPHKTVTVNPGERKELILKCPGRRQLMGGGYQQTERISRQGNFATESRATSSKTWRVAGTATGDWQNGKMVGIAYCLRSKKPLIREVSASVDIGRSSNGSATTPKCPKGRTLAFGGFSTPEDGSILYLGGSMDPGGTWTVQGFNQTGTTGKLTGYGYCLQLNKLNPKNKKKKKK